MGNGGDPVEGRYMVQLTGQLPEDVATLEATEGIRVCMSTASFVFCRERVRIEFLDPSGDSLRWVFPTKNGNQGVMVCENREVITGEELVEVFNRGDNGEALLLIYGVVAFRGM